MADFHTLGSEDISALQKEGYQLLEPIGEGKTRTVYRALYETGAGMKKLRVVKIPKENIDGSSFATRVNTHGRVLGEREATVANQLQHQNISAPVDNFRLPSGKIVNVEEHFDAEDLESIVCSPTRGKLNDLAFRHVFSSVLTAARYLNEEARVLHRDIKPSNILVGKNAVKLSDLENCAKMEEIRHKSLPTRGGTAFTHPYLLNVTNGWGSHADTQTEIYAIGASMFYALTGEYPLAYDLREDPNGREIKLGDETVRIALFDGDRRIDYIETQNHDRAVARRIKIIPKQYRRLIERALILSSDEKAVKRRYQNLAEFEEEFNEQPGWLKEYAWYVAKKSALPLLGAGLFYALVRLDQHEWKQRLQDPATTIRNVMTEQQYKTFTLDDIEPYDRQVISAATYPSYDQARQRLPEIWAQTDLVGIRKGQEIAEATRALHGQTGLPKRFTAAFINTCLAIERDRYCTDQDARMHDTFIPLDIHAAFTRGEERRTRGFALSGRYLLQLTPRSKNVGELAARYFCEESEILAAQLTAETQEFWHHFTGRQEPHRSGIGWVNFLPEKRQYALNTFVGLYLHTNEDGTVCLTRQPDFFDYELRDRLSRAVSSQYGRR